MTSDTTTLHGQLRQWARGMTTLTAATELLIQIDRASSGSPRVVQDGTRPWIDFARIPDSIGALSGGEQRVLRIAASIADAAPISLGDEISGLDHKHAHLVLAALAQAAGYGAPIRSIDIVDGQPVFVTKPAIMEWPA
jgi:ABC-type branched-subunit amino acid transport system ATPase component